MLTSRELGKIYRKAHNSMRNIDGLQPQESFDELLKYLFYKQQHELTTTDREKPSINSVRKEFSNCVKEASYWLKQTWRDRKIHLSDDCLKEIHRILYPIIFSSLNYDIRRFKT